LLPEIPPQQNANLPDTTRGSDGCKSAVVGLNNRNASFASWGDGAGRCKNVWRTGTWRALLEGEKRQYA